MEVFDNRFNKNITKAQSYSGRLLDGNIYNIDGVERVNGAVHKGTLKTDIYIAQMSASNSKGFVGFEVNASQAITPEFYDAIAEKYLAKKDNDCCTYIGVLGKENNQINTILNSKVSKNFLEQYAKREMEIEKRKPKFVCINDDDYDKIYKSVNINTGEELYLSDTNKVCKDAYKTYLYTAKLSYDADRSYNIAFETDFRIQDIVFDKADDQITGISNLLSVELDSLSKKKLNYIGKLCYDGAIERDLKSSSHLLTHTLKRIQKQF